MAKTRKQKEGVLEAVNADVAAAKAMVFTGYHGLSVPEIEKLRRALRAEKVSYRVIKKTLLQKVFTDRQINVDAKAVGAALAVAFGLSDEVAPAKILAKFQKEHEALKIYGGWLEHKFIDAAGVLALAKLPSREELYAKLVGSINAPVSGFVNTLSGTIRSLVNVLNGIKDVKAN